MTESAESKLVQAAILLMQEKAPSRISGRELAASAGVNYGLIHHHFGSKYEVFRQAISQLVHDYIAEVESSGARNWLDLDFLEDHRMIWQILAQFVLDEQGQKHLEWPLIVMRQQLSIKAEQFGDRHAKETAAAEAAFVFGWILFQPFPRKAYDLDPENVANVVAGFKDNSGA